MPNLYKTVGQAAPAANTDTVLYTVPANKQFVGSSIIICNRNTAGAACQFRIAVVPSGETLADKHYLYFDQLISSRDTISKLLGISLSAGDQVIIRASTVDLSFSLFGSEIF